MRKMRNWAQLIFVALKMRKFAPTRKPVALETLILTLCRYETNEETQSKANVSKLLQLLFFLITVTNKIFTT